MGAAFRDWLARVLEHGESVLTGPPTATSADWRACEPLLASAYRGHALSVAGPPPAFAEPTAWAAAGVLATACWRLVGDGEPLPLRMPVPTTPADHLSADVLLRFLPAVRRRAAVRADDGLAAEVESVLRAWPLSGVLADLDGVPASGVEFGGHPGLQLLYGERLAALPRGGWVPAGGSARGWAERAFADRRRPLPAPPPPEVSL